MKKSKSKSNCSSDSSERLETPQQDDADDSDFDSDSDEIKRNLKKLNRWWAETRDNIEGSEIFNKRQYDSICKLHDILDSLIKKM